MFSTMPQDFGAPLLLEDYIPVPPPVTDTSSPLCAVCHTPTSPLRCSTCKSLHYCSPTCQTLDWGTHKLLCKPFTITAHVDKRPDASYRRALFLSDTSSKPRFIWLKYGDDGRPLDMAKCFPGSSAGEIKTIAFHNRYLPYWIQISYVVKASGCDFVENVCVQRLLDVSSETSSLGSSESGIEAKKGEVWRGPLVVLAYSAQEGLSKPALDVNPGVLGPVVEYLRLRRGYGGPVFVEQPQEWYEKKEWKTTLGGLGQ